MKDLASKSEDEDSINWLLMQSYPPRALDRILQEDWSRDVGKGPRVLMSLKWHLQSPFLLLHSATINLQEAKDSNNEEDPRPTSSTWSCGKKNKREKKKEKRVEEISQDEREKIREEERRKIMKEMKREKHVSYSSHNSCRSLKGQPLIVKEECKEVSVSSKRLAKKERNFEIKTNFKEISPLKQPPHFLLCKKTLVSIATPLGLELIPQVKELLDEGLVRKSLNPYALLVPKIGIIRHQIPKIGGMMNVLSGANLFCKITRAPNIFMICVHRDSLGSGISSLSLPSPFRCHSSSKKQRNPLMKKILGLQAPMELTSSILLEGQGEDN
ncbi:hypothetical protein HKD37_06G016591 [Glycine soja]